MRAPADQERPEIARHDADLGLQKLLRKCVVSAGGGSAKTDVAGHTVATPVSRSTGACGRTSKAAPLAA
jgi:hypothetical protein